MKYTKKETQKIFNKYTNLLMVFIGMCIILYYIENSLLIGIFFLIVFMGLMLLSAIFVQLSRIAYLIKKGKEK